MYEREEKEEIKKRLKHIIEFCKKIEKFTDETEYTEYLESEILYLAFERLLENVGQALNKTPSVFKEKHPEIEWREIIGMRNIIAHNYDNIDEDVIWKACKEKIPTLKIKIIQILNKIE